MRNPSQQHLVSLAALAAAILCGLAAIAAAAPVYTIQTIGLTDAAHTRDDGVRYNQGQSLNEAGQVLGIAERYSGATNLGQSAWFYDGASTQEIGLTDAAHTHSDGYQYNAGQYLSAAGQVAGYAYRYNGATSLGQSAWFYDGASTLEIGLVDAAHTRDDGYQYNLGLSLNAAGQVAGYAYRYNGATSLGQSAWFYDGASTLEIGLTDAAHTSDDGYQYNAWQYLNAAGQVAGYADRYSGATSLGRSAWLFNGASTLEIGLTDAAHTSDDGYQYNYGQSFNAAGQVAGYAFRYNGADDLGNSAWLFNGASTLEIGLTDAAHTRDDGYRYNWGQSLNAAGQVAGYAARYSGADYLGNSAWLFNGASTQEIGLTDAAHTRDDGYQYNAGQFLNAAGQVAGYAFRYNGADNLGNSAWLFNGASTLEIGLTDAAHTRDDGYQNNRGQFLNAAGQVAGYADRFSGADSLGQSTWLYNDASTQEIGLTDAAHTRDDGYQYNYEQSLNAAGQVAGYAYRYNGATSLGLSAWLFDPTADETLALVISTRADGYAFSTPSYLGDDGLLLGSYTLYDGMTQVGTRAFSFTMQDGLYDLGELVEGGLDGAGWAYLASAVRSNGAGQILGYGLLEGMPGGQVAYLLTPVPEPSTILLLAMSAVGLGLGGCRRFRKGAPR